MSGNEKQAAQDPQSAARHDAGAPSELPVKRAGALIAAASVLLLVPCFWQSRLQMSDLESHIYNAWLAQLIQTGRAAGLAIVPQVTNVLFDWILSALFRVFGAGPAQRISVAASVLIFAWGAFAFASRVAGRRPWELLPLLGILAHGWTLHMGFMNFYLSLGLCFWAMSLAWNLTARGFLLAAPLLAVAVLAHALPVVWAVGILGYAWVWRQTPIAHKWALLGGALLAVALGVSVLGNFMPTLWFTRQLMNSLGIDQSMVFGSLVRVHRGRADGVLRLPVVSIFAPGGSGQGVREPARSDLDSDMVESCCWSPTASPCPGYKNSLMYIADRMSLAAGVCLCAVLASAPARRFAVWGTGAAAVLFFGFLYADERVLNQVEDRLEALVRQLPPYQRVIGGMVDPSFGWTR